MAVLGRCIRIDDPRNRLERMKKRELVEYAHLNGQMDINANMQADDYKDINGRVTPGIRSLLSQRGLNGLAIDGRRLGQMGRQETVSILPRNPKPVAPAQATDDEWAEFQKWKASQQKPAAPALRRAKPERPPRLVERPKSEINKLREECQRLGIKMERRDRMDDLKAKIAAHGKDAPQLRQ